MKVDFDVVIIGAGVAGMTAALYLKRANINCCLIEKDAPGGQINKTSKIENYPGFLEINGADLAYQMYEQLMAIKVDYRYGDVENIIVQDEIKIVKTNTSEITCHYVLLTSGRTPRKLGLAKEEELTGHGISYCATCDGPLYKNKNVIVVGGGDSALEETRYLATICKKVTLIHRREYFTAQQILIDTVLALPNVKTVLNSEVSSYDTKEDQFIGVTVRNKETNRKRKIKADGLFLFVGQVPNTTFVKELGITNATGYVEVDRNYQTTIPGIYAAGDVIDKKLYQIVTATGEAASAAIEIARMIEKRNT